MSHPHPYLPPPFDASPPDSLTLVAQGAEALLYRTAFWDHADAATDTAAGSAATGSSPLVALKVRPPKPWRHPSLDRRLTRQRILAEARVLAKCRRDGVAVPAVYLVDWEAGWSAVEWIEGPTVKATIRNQMLGGADEESEEAAGTKLRELLRKIGRAVGKLHAVGVIHGDLTTSNMLLRPNVGEGKEETKEGDLGGEIVLIDFGLAVQAVQEEDRAVDLYVLERAFGSTHPREEEEFGEVLKAYEGCYKGAKATLRRLEDVRMRGRKKSMIG